MNTFVLVATLAQSIWQGVSLKWQPLIMLVQVKGEQVWAFVLLA